MENDEQNYFNLITYENNEENNNSVSEEMDTNKNQISKSDSLKNSNKKVISEKLQKDYSLENMIFKQNKESINSDSITNSNKKELINNNYEAKTFNITIDNDNKKKLKYAINNINLNSDSTTNNQIKICGKEKAKNYENKSFASLKSNHIKNPKLFKSFRQNKNILDNSLTKRGITISSDRNPNKLKVITNYNSTYYRNNNTNIYSNGINKNKKKIFSSLKRKSNTPKLKNSCSSVCENKSPKITNKKRYNSSRHNSSKNENEINKNNIKTYEDIDNNLNNTNAIRKDILNINDSSFVVGHVGRFVEQKNHEFLIDIFYAYLQKNKNAILLLIGDGPLKEKIRKKCLEKGILDKVYFLGKRSDVNELYNCMDCFVFPSLFEGMPNTVIEAQTNGLKCIVSSKITKDVDLTGNVVFHELNKPEEWADDIEISVKRESVHEIVKDMGYNIHDNML